MAYQRDANPQRVLVPPSRHITTTYDELVAALSGDGGDHKAVAALLDSVTLHDFQLVRRRLKQNFRPFAVAAAGYKIGSRPSAPELDKQEMQFLDDLCTLLQAAHFQVLTRDEWQMACDNDFTFTNPLEVAWENMEQNLMRRFWTKREDEFCNAAAISESVLVMHRGVHVARARGMFLEDKIDMLVLYLIAGPCERILRPLVERFVEGGWTRVWPKFSIVDTVKSAGLYHNSRKGDQQGKQHTFLEEHQVQKKDPQLDHENAQWVERVTLKDVMPNASAVFKQLFKTITIQEPTFRDALILFRRKTRSQAQKQDEKAILKDASPEDLERNIHVKRFQDIPLADLEMIFPDKKVFLKPLLLIQLVVTILIGLASVIVTVLTTEASWSLIGAVLSIIGTRAFQVWSSAQLGRQKVLDQMTVRLYEQTMDAQDGVIYFLLDQMVDQHVKELLLAYFLLLQLGRPLTREQLDRCCENYLKEHFGEAVDFALEKSLPALIDDGLVSEDSEGRLHPISISEGRKILVAKGETYFSNSADAQSAEPSLLSRASSARGGSVKEAQVAGSDLGTLPAQGTNPGASAAKEKNADRISSSVKGFFKSHKKDT